MTVGLHGKAMAYDGENRPLSVDFAGKRTSYTYGADGARLWREVSGASAERVLYLGPVEIRDLDGSEEVLLYPLPSVRIHVVPADNTVTEAYLHTDQLGSVRVITEATKPPTERTYKPFGETSFETLANPAEDHAFIGERRDQDAGLLYLNARYMDPELGMFLQPDWFEVTISSVGTNRYAYAVNDPINLSDPGGNCPVCVVVWGGLTIADWVFVGTVVTTTVVVATNPDARKAAGDVVDSGVELAGNAFSSDGGDEEPNVAESRWSGDAGAAEWGRRNGIGSREGKNRFHGIKQGTPGSRGDDDYTVDPESGEVYDQDDEPVGNLNDED